MKQFLLPVLLWTLATSQSFAQHITSATLQQELDALPKAAKKHLQNAGFALNQNAHKAQARTTPLQLDSTKTFAAYQSLSDSLPLTRNVFEYQADKQIETQYQFDVDTWIPVGRSTSTIDNLDRAVQNLSEVYDQQTAEWHNESFSVVFPRGNSAILYDSLKVFQWDPELQDWTLAFKSVYTYGVQDRVELVESFFSTDEGDFAMKQQYTYDVNQDNTLITTYLVSSGFSIPFTRQEMQYTSHRLIQTISYTVVGPGTFEPNARSTYFHNAAGLLEQQNEYAYVPDVNDWEPVQTLYYTYDSQQRLATHETHSIQDGLPDVKVRETYTYVQDYDLALTSILVWNDALDGYELSERTFYYYAQGSVGVFPTPQQVQALQISPNPTSAEVRFSIDADAQIRVFDAAGKMLQSGIVAAGETLNLNALPAGIYQVTALQDKKLYVGKVVKQ